jgi:hypothetical protein
VPNADNSLERVQTELGDPDAAFGARNAGKYALALGLLAASAAGHTAWWLFGPAKFTGVIAKLLFLPPILAVGLLWHLYRTRGLHVLLYPTGLLRFQRGEVESYPWAEVTALHLKADQGSVELLHGADGGIRSAWLEVDPPVFQLWAAWLSLTRQDGETAKLTPAVSGYADLVVRVQRTMFSILWPRIWEQYREGRVVPFGPFEIGRDGLRSGDKFLPWPQLAEVAVASKHVTVKKKGKWLAWASHELEQVPNPHLFLALVHEARREAVPGLVSEEGEDED